MLCQANCVCPEFLFVQQDIMKAEGQCLKAAERSINKVDIPKSAISQHMMVNHSPQRVSYLGAGGC